MPFSKLGLSDPLLRAIADAGYSTPSPIQLQAIPAVLNGHDLLAAARTGTGKTAGFALPILHRLSQHSYGANRPVRVLILTPTRELAAQVGESVSKYGAHLHPRLKTEVVFGGVKKFVISGAQLIQLGVSPKHSGFQSKTTLSDLNSLQPHYNLVHRAEFERELADVCNTYGIGVIPYSPLAGGFLSNKYACNQNEPESARLGGVKRRYFNDKGWAIHDFINNMASQLGKTISQIEILSLVTH